MNVLGTCDYNKPPPNALGRAWRAKKTGAQKNLPDSSQRL
jgi:hypothetical protein